MSETKIEWCDYTLNLWTGCTKVDIDCKNCYAEKWANRSGHSVWGPNGKRTEVKSWKAKLDEIIKASQKSERRLRVFCQSLSDTFELGDSMGGYTSENWKLVSGLQSELFRIVRFYKEIDFLILTKRPENIVDIWVNHSYGNDSVAPLPENVWLGISAGNQKTLEKRLHDFRGIPFEGVKFISLEPLIGHVNLDIVDSTSFIDWLILGGESGAYYREMPYKTAQMVIQQCKEKHISVFVKQDSAFKPAQQGRFTNEEWAIKEFPK